MSRLNKVVLRGGVKYRLVPPEGGWGYMTCVSIAIQLTALFAPASCFGLIYNDFLVALGEGTSSVTLVHGVYCIVLSITGFISNALLKRLSLRQVSLMGSGIFCVGSFLGIFVQSSIHLLITNGLIQAAGVGLSFPLTYTAFNNYFTKKRLAYLSAIKLVIGLVSVATPLLVRLSMDNFGFRGTLLMLFGTSLNSVLASAMLQPVDWHLKLEEIVVEEGAEALVNGDSKENIKTAKEDVTCCPEEIDKNAKNGRYKSKEALFNFEHKCETQELSKTISEMELREKNGDSNSVRDRRFSHDDIGTEKSKYMKELLKASSVMSLAYHPVEPLPTVIDSKERLKSLVDYFDLSLFKDLVYTNIIFGMAVAGFVDGTFYALLPLYLYKIEWDSSSVANAMSLVAGGDMVGRFLLMVSSKMLNNNSRTLYLVGMLTTVLLRCAFVLLNGRLETLGLLTTMGLVRCLMHVTSPLVLAEHVPIQRYPAAYSLFMLVFGFINVLGGPVIGLIRDVTDSYPLVFNMLTCTLVVFSVPWVVEGQVTRRRARKTASQT